MHAQTGLRFCYSQTTNDRFSRVETLLVGVNVPYFERKSGTIKFCIAVKNPYRLLVVTYDLNAQKMDTINNATPAIYQERAL